MAQMINSVTLAGNLTKDPELRSTANGTSVCSLRVANNRRRKVGEEWKDVAGFFDVTVWGKQGENCAKFLNKGRGVLVRGELRWREWEGENGKRQAIEINADEVQFLGGGQSESERYEASADFKMEAPVPEPAAAAAEEDDIPFLRDEFSLGFEAWHGHTNR